MTACLSKRISNALPTRKIPTSRDYPLFTARPTALIDSWGKFLLVLAKKPSVVIHCYTILTFFVLWYYTILLIVFHVLPKELAIYSVGSSECLPTTHVVFCYFWAKCMQKGLI